MGIDMRGRASLQRRLLALALATVAVVWIGTAAFTYFDALKVDKLGCSVCTKTCGART